MKLMINAVSAKRGGAVTYLQNMLPSLGRILITSPGDRIVVWRAAGSTASETWPEGIEYREDPAATGGKEASGASLRRMWFDQWALPGRVKREGFDALFSSANFGPLRSPCRQVLLVRNPVYFDDVLISRLRSRKARAYHAGQRWLTLRSMGASDVVLFPTKAMLDLVADSAGAVGSNWRVAHYGTRHDLFRPAESARPRPRPLRLLNVSHYSDQKNLGTLLRALDLLASRDSGRFALELTAGFDRAWMGESAFFPYFLEERSIYESLRQRGIAADVDWKSYGSLPELYRAADVFVFPSYLESFGHPLLEAMASGLPIVAADMAVNRELCGDAAVYFPPFDATALATALERVEEDPALRAALAGRALSRVREFTWDRHARILADALLGRESAA